MVYCLLLGLQVAFWFVIIDFSFYVGWVYLGLCVCVFVSRLFNFGFVKVLYLLMFMCLLSSCLLLAFVTLCWGVCVYLVLFADCTYNLRCLL